MSSPKEDENNWINIISISNSMNIILKLRGLKEKMRIFVF